MAEQDAAAPAAPTHYAVRLLKPFPIPGTQATVPAGDVIVAAAIVDQMPPDIILSKTPAAA